MSLVLDKGSETASSVGFVGSKDLSMVIHSIFVQIGVVRGCSVCALNTSEVVFGQVWTSVVVFDLPIASTRVV